VGVFPLPLFDLPAAPALPPSPDAEPPAELDADAFEPVAVVPAPPPPPPEYPDAPAAPVPPAYLEVPIELEVEPPAPKVEGTVVPDVALVPPPPPFASSVVLLPKYESFPAEAAVDCCCPTTTL
jgi:hypothetical protein